MGGEGSQQEVGVGLTLVDAQRDALEEVVDTESEHDEKSSRSGLEKLS